MVKKIHDDPKLNNNHIRCLFPNIIRQSQSTTYICISYHFLGMLPLDFYDGLGEENVKILE